MHLAADHYIHQILDGHIPACRWVKLACQRHLDDLQSAESRALYYDETAARLAVAFFHTLLKHWKGEWAGQPVTLEPWQQFIVTQLFGWKRADGTRRYKSAYIEVARKNGKTLLAAGIGLYMMIADGEPGAEVYSAATKRDQARLTHRDAIEMVRQSPHLMREVGIVKDNIHHERSRSKFEPLGRDADTIDGLNVSCAIIDEFHAHKTRDLYNKLETATASRRQPLIFSITTAGIDRHSVCHEFHTYTQTILNNEHHDDTFFGIIYTLDDGDDWEDETTWYKANPNLGVSKKIADMRRLAERAKQLPAQLNAFLQLHLDIWVTAAARWIPPDDWAACALPVPLDQLAGRRAYGGLDLATTTDIASYVVTIPPQSPDEPYYIIPHFFCPEESIVTRSKTDRVPYLTWQRNGYLTATPGNVIDYAYIYAAIDQSAETYDLQETAFDRWGSQAIVNDLQTAGHTMIQFGQGYASMSPIMREFEHLLLGRRLAHNGHPVLTWMAANVVATSDPAGNLKPDKARSREKIDGIVALLMSLSRAVAYIKTTTIYRTRGLRTL